MAFEKRTWFARLGIGLNKFIIGNKDSQGKQTLQNSPDSVTQQGDVISADNLNDLEDRIETAFIADGEDISANTTAITNMKATRVWLNPDPLTDFGAQIVECSQSLEAHSILIMYMTTAMITSRRTRQYKMVGLPSTGFPAPTIPSRVASLTDVILDSSSPFLTVRSRGIAFLKGKELIFGDCLEYDNTTTTDNSQLIPLAIYIMGSFAN